eukprot:TRINITY_DN2596_c0_g3_i7.p1 TRINITY_DN2596_c0_g3~~TRINITY_DN2596_c0_g3_i7.p1  ORF type:complete len:289 (+),score=59.11 TRINITY_DN2596_c0_g3_i7:72-938(+)
MTSSAPQNVRIASCQLMVTEDKEQNLSNARRAIREAAQNGARLVVLPEIFNSPYANSSFPVYAEEIPGGPSTEMLQQEAKSNNIYLVGGSIPEKEGEKLFNTCTVYGPDGVLLAKHRKVHLFDISIPGKITFKESDTLTAGNQITTFETDFCKVGVGICYDIRFAELAQVMVRDGCKLLVYPGAFNTTTGPAHWELLQRGRAIDNQVYVCTASPARNPNSGYQAWGHSTIVSPWGEVMATCDHDATILYADLDFGRLEEIRQQIPISVQRRNDLILVPIYCPLVPASV